MTRCCRCCTWTRRGFASALEEFFGLPAGLSVSVIAWSTIDWRDEWWAFGGGNLSCVDIDRTAIATRSLRVAPGAQSSDKHER